MTDTPKQKIESMTAWIERVYNPEHDVVSGGPVVTATDEILMRCVRQLLKMVEDLESQVYELKAGIK